MRMLSSFCVLSYVWQHLDIGYVQGMCDLLAPLLVILDDGTLTLSLTLFTCDPYDLLIIKMFFSPLKFDCTYIILLYHMSVLLGKLFIVIINLIIC